MGLNTKQIASPTDNPDQLCERMTWGMFSWVLTIYILD